MTVTTPSTSEAERHAALLFTDIVDSTRIHAEIGDAAARRLWESHDRSARALARTWRGREIGRSDGFLMLFESAEDALGYALDYQRMTAALEPPFAARVGVHWGEVVLRENDAADVATGATPFEVDGISLPTAARILAAAHGGQILLSASAAAALSTPQPAGTQRCSHGHWRLKGLTEPLELIELAARDAVLIPPADSAKAYRVVSRDGLWMPVAQLPHNLPPEPDRFIGRQTELHAIAAAFEASARLVTLVGIGGMGKTRLAQRYARGWLGSHPGGAWFCDLSAATSVDGIAHAVAQALDVPLGRTDPIQQLATVIAGRDDCLLILDNFEQVARHAAATLGVWLNAAPAARFIVTSREVLGLPGEQVEWVAPMTSSEAQALFRQHMHAAGLHEGLVEADTAALPELVELLDRLPLAIELAAARARTVPPADQVLRIGERFRLLAGRSGRRHDRQATLRATLDWSWELLGPDEQQALAQLSVFERGFTLEAAEAVVRVDWDDTVDGEPWTAELIHSLLEKSLIRRVHARRFDLLRTVQDYAAERLAKIDPDGGAARRHWEHFAGLSTTVATADSCVELDNLVIACRRATAADVGTGREGSAATAAAVAALVLAWSALRLSGPFRAALTLAKPLIQHKCSTPRQHACVLRVLGGSYSLLGHAVQAREAYANAITAAQLAGDRPLQAQLTALLADFEVRNGLVETGESMLRGVLVLADGDEEATVIALNSLGNLALASSHLVTARRHFEHAALIALRLDDPRWNGGLQGSLGSVAILEGRLTDAHSHLEIALAAADRLGDRQWAGNARCNLGLLLHELGDDERARLELKASINTARLIGHRRLEAMSVCNLGLVACGAGQLGEARTLFDRAIEVALSLGDQRLEGRFRGYLAATLTDLRAYAEADLCFDAARTLLDTARDATGSALLACQRGVLAARTLKADLVDSALSEAEALVANLGEPVEHEVTQALSRLRKEVSRLN